MKPTHYKMVCISLYTEDIDNLRALVYEAKANGHTRANQSAMIRYALSLVDVSKMPREARRERVQKPKPRKGR